MPSRWSGRQPKCQTAGGCPKMAAMGVTLATSAIWLVLAIAACKISQFVKLQVIHTSTQTKFNKFIYL